MAREEEKSHLSFLAISDRWEIGVLFLLCFGVSGTLDGADGSFDCSSVPVSRCSTIPSHLKKNSPLNISTRLPPSIDVLGFSS